MHSIATILQAMEDVLGPAHQASQGQEPCETSIRVRKNKRAVRACIGPIEQDATDMGDVLDIPIKTASSHSDKTRL